jgi:hypothetical protein
MKRTPTILLSARLQVLVIPSPENPLIIRSPILFMIYQVTGPYPLIMLNRSGFEVQLF